MPIWITIAALVIVAILVFIVTRPGSFHIERSAQINAPADVIFPMIRDFHQWVRWSPYENLDPNMKKTYGGPTGQPGATYEWVGNSKAGEGRMTMMEIKASELVSFKLEFSKPFKATNQGSFKFVPSVGGTRVTWSMDGKNNFMGKVMSPFMDGMIGKEFEKGLTNLNTVAQTEIKQPRQGAQSA
jgi:hypothetical protein